MTMKFFRSATAILRRVESLARAAPRARRTGPDPFNPGSEAPPGRYFGLLVHVDRSER
jgi:hypothetical protein